MSLMPKPLILLGSGGHAAVVAEVLQETGLSLLAVVSPDSNKLKGPLKGIKRIESDQALLDRYSPSQVELVNGIGTLPGNLIQRKLFKQYVALGYSFVSVISPHAKVSGYVELGQGVQIMAGVVIQPNVRIGDNTLLNTACSIDHDCEIGSNNHIAPGARLSGGVITGHQVHVGTGATIIQGIKIGDDAVIGAGAAVVRNVPEKQIVLPARVRKKSE